MYYFLTFLFLILFTFKSITFSKLHNEKRLSKVIYDSSWFISYILLQQIALFLFWQLTSNLLSNIWQSITVSLVFAITHLHFFYKYRAKDGLIIFIPSLFGGFLFSYLYIHYYILGLFVSFLIHIFFHILLDIYFFNHEGKPMKSFYKK
jgi:hypothetical protein